jgi:hypothetical protein
MAEVVVTRRMQVAPAPDLLHGKSRGGDGCFCLHPIGQGSLHQRVAPEMKIGEKRGGRVRLGVVPLLSKQCEKGMQILSP